MPGARAALAAAVGGAAAANAIGCPYCSHAGPASPADQPDWLQSLIADRNNTLQSIGYTGGVFDTPELKWTQTSYIQPQMHPFDRFFYDPTSGNYTVQKYLQDLKDRYGGIDSLLLWPTYTNIGVDDRNQFDLFRAMPGGLDGITRITRELKASGVRVLWAYNPWDIGTRREPLSDEDTMAQLIKQTGGDGLNGDTMIAVKESFAKAAQKVGYPLALEPELGGTNQALNWATMGWGYWDFSSKVPVVDRLKFITSGKYLTNVCDRWAKSKTDNLQMAWFNGDGYESWENVWGSWNGIVPRDGEAIRRVSAMLRYFGAAGFLQSPLWEPHAPGVAQPGVYASRWPSPSRGETLWTVVNRGGGNLTGPQITLPPPEGERKYYDCYHGIELKAAPTPNGSVQLAFPIEAGGYGCVVDAAAPAGGAFADFLAGMRRITQRSLASYSAEWSYLRQTVVDIPATAAPAAPAGTVLVPKGTFDFACTGVEVEHPDEHGVDVQFPWEDRPQLAHEKKGLKVGPFHIDKFPVTCANYSAYLQAAGYRPKDPYNWLKSWGGQGTCPAALADTPVTYVSLNEARLYCKWAGGRLPHSWEWQYAAQGTDGRKYPWGNEKNQSYYPVRHGGKSCPGPENVTAHAPAGDSPFGVSDLVGNVWQYTDEVQDEHTRAVIVRGGSNYRPLVLGQGTLWYFPQALELDKHNKYFLMDDSYERSATIGFRCVYDAEA